VFAARELIEIAMRIEENGENFYRMAAEKIEDQTARLLFYHLSDEEARHRQIFAGFLDEVESYEPPENYPGEHRAYIEAYADHLIFSTEIVKNGPWNFTDAKSVIRFAIQKETESILFYREIKGYFPQARQSLLASIIDEERKHFTELSRLLKNY